MSSRAGAPEHHGAVLDGVRPIIEALRAGRREVYEICLPEELSTPGLRELEALARERAVRVVRGAGGAKARVSRFRETSIEDLLVRSGPRYWVAFDRLTDVGNLGSIARSAETAGATALILESRHSPPVDGGASRASAGAIEHLDVARVPSLPRALALAAGEGVRVVGADMGGIPIGAVEPAHVAGDLICVFGSEDRGLRSAVRERLALEVAIPLRGRVSSLGVAATAGILLHRLAELRDAGSEPPAPEAGRR